MFEEAAAFTLSGWNGDADAISAWNCRGGAAYRRYHSMRGGEGWCRRSLSNKPSESKQGMRNKVMMRTDELI
jgi:hypothetical protein